MKDEQFIQISINRYNEIIEQLKEYEKSLVKIYHYSNFKENAMEFIEDELNHIFSKYR